MTTLEKIKLLDANNIGYDDELVDEQIQIINDASIDMKERMKSFNYLSNYINLIYFYKI